MLVLRVLFIWVLVLLTALDAPLANAAQANRLSARVLLLAQSGSSQRLWTQAKIAGSSAELRVKAQTLMLAPAKGIGSAILNDVFQAALIMAAAATAQLAKDKMERENLLGGYQPKYPEVQKHALAAAEELLCANTAKTATVLGEVTCSGEFWMGFLGGLGVRAAAQATVIQALKLLLKSSPTRAAMISTVGTFATSFLMLSGFQMSSYLWTQSINVMNDKQKEERAHNLFGRATKEWISGNWASYVQTEDGKIAAEAFENMNNILLVDSGQRAAWVNNAWRFGLARGEMIVNLTVLMGALAAGSAVGAGLAGIAGLAGLPAAALTFAVASGIGAGVSALIVYLPDAQVGEHLTVLIQNTRGWLADFNHGLTRAHIDVAAQAFDLNRYQTAATQKYKRRHEVRLRMLIPQLNEQRVNWVNIAFEKYHELQGKLEQAEATLQLANEVIMNSDLRGKIQFAAGTQFMSYEQAKERYCPRSGGRPAGPASCNFALSHQLKIIAEAKAKIKEGQELLASIGEAILTRYDEDAALYQKYLDNVNLQFPPDVAEMIKDENERIATLADALAWNFGANHPQIRAQRQLDFGSNDELKMMKIVAKDFVARTYLQGLNEAEYLEKLKLATR